MPGEGGDMLKYNSGEEVQIQVLENRVKSSVDKASGQGGDVGTWNISQNYN